MNTLKVTQSQLSLILEAVANQQVTELRKDRPDYTKVGQLTELANNIKDTMNRPAPLETA